MLASSTFTYQTRIMTASDSRSLVDQYAALYGKVERTLFAALAAGKSAAALKPGFCTRFDITSRQYNAISMCLKGKIASIQERRKGLIQEAKIKISEIKKAIQKLEKVKPKDDAHKKRIDFSLHHKKRGLDRKNARLAAMQDDEKNGIVRLCFGSKKRFSQQFHLAENGFADHAAWQTAWRDSRSSQFLVIGSRDETSGCQGCVATMNADGSFNLQLRLPNGLASGERKHLSFVNVWFPYGQQQLAHSLAAGRAISYRFKRDIEGWRVYASTEVLASKTITHTLAGVIGLDINADHLAVTQIDRFGNPVSFHRLDCVTYGQSSDQASAIIGDQVKILVHLAKDTSRPIVMENLDFGKKKAALYDENPRYARMLSGFAYAEIKAVLTSACLRAGVEIIEINPALTSVIGAVNFAQRLGISVHQGAALAIARRALGLSERPTLRGVSVPTRRGGHVTFALPARNRAKHVWSFWSKVRTRLKAAHVAHVRSGDYLKAPQPLPQERVPAECSTWALPARFRHANRQGHCSPDVWPDVPF